MGNACLVSLTDIEHFGFMDTQVVKHAVRLKHVARRQQGDLQVWLVLL